MKCKTCQTHEVNPMITDSDKVPGISFCSRLCQDLYRRIDLEFVSSEALKRIALMQHEQLVESDNVNNQ